MAACDLWPVLLSLVFLSNPLATSSKKFEQIKTTEDLLHNSKLLMRTVKKYIHTKSDVLSHLEKITDFWASKAKESNQDPYLYVQNPLNCLKILSTLVIDLNLHVANLLNEANSIFQYSDQILGVNEKHLEEVVLDLKADVLQQEWTWEEFIMKQNKLDNDDKMQLLKMMHKTKIISTRHGHELTMKIF